MQVYEDIDDFSGHADTIFRSLKPSASQEGIMATSAALGATVSSVPSVMPAQIKPVDYGEPPVLGYVLGALAYDFGDEARRDSFEQAGLQHPSMASELLAYLADAPYDAARVIWTLNIDATPVYAIQPAGAFADVTYGRLREFLNGQLNEGVTRVSIPGFVGGKVQLMSGQTVPVIVPVLRGMYSWSTPALVQAVLGEKPEGDEAQAQHAQREADVHNFLERVYYELRNLGMTSQERAINFAATNAFQIAQVFEQAIQDDLQLDRIEVEKSPICRPGSDCWDVKLTFFDPENRLGRARRVYRFTIDVSDVIPVTVGAVRSFNVY